MVLPYFVCMKTVAIITGGKSPEHDVAIVSARNIYNALDHTKYNICVIGISRDGRWFHMADRSLFEENTEIGTSPDHRPLCIMPFDPQPLRYASDVQNHLQVDVFFPIAHGVYGEDGILQGVMEYMDRPYVGPGVLGSAIGMDKDVTKQILQHNGIMVTPWHTYFKGDNIDFLTLELMGFPLFVKPANMGSGVGVEKAENLEELKKAIEHAFDFDHKILIEKGIKGREIETAVLGNLKPEVTGVGEIVVSSGFYTYENKYVNNETKVIIPAENLSQQSVYLIQQTAIRAYRCLQLEGMSRVDFFYVSDKEFYLNEVNTLPGFTNISMYPQLWQAEGVLYPDLLDRLIHVAIERYESRSELRRER
jgi:D-alanine-D-alanine ligase